MPAFQFSRFSLVLLAFAVTALAAAPAPPPFLSPLFGEHMLLQRDRPNRLWGWTTPGARVEVILDNLYTSAVADREGRWQIETVTPPAGGPYTLTIDGPQHLAFHDIMVGDVWLCGGQSNMAFGLTESRDGADAAKNSTEPAIRLFRVAQQPGYAPTATPRGEWKRCEPESFTINGGFSAVAYYFAKKLHAETGVPIGLIQDAVGGSPAESWMSPESLGKLPEFVPALTEIARLRTRGGPVYGNYIMHWYDEYDRGLAGTSWGAATFDDSKWKTTTLHTAFADLGVPETPAVVWFRREVVLPETLPPGTAKILLGVIEKMDTTQINGRWIGASSWVENPRAYPIPDGVLHPGKNLVTIRVLKLKPDGGFQSPPDAQRLVLGDGTVIPLEGEWRAAVSVDAKPPHPLPLGYENYPTMPAVLYLGMIRPVAPLALTGVIWYQGEANFQRPRQYRALLPAVIADWRALFGRPDLPFYVVSLPAFMARRDQPGTDGWAELRESQTVTVRATPHTGLAITVDTGDAGNIHPTDKQPVGERLALCALKALYGKDVVASGPIFDRLEKISGGLRIHFSNTFGGLAVHGEKLGEFSVAGADHVWHWADAKLDGETVVLTCPAVPEPIAARYAWQANPLATLFNGAGLPAAPFRTDDWPLSDH